MSNSKPPRAILGLLLALAGGFALGRVTAPPQSQTPSEEVAAWQELGYGRDAARVLVTRARTGLLPSEIRKEMAPPAQAPAVIEPPTPEDRCARLDSSRFGSPAAWRQALLDEGEGFAGLVRMTDSEKDQNKRIGQLLAEFAALCPENPRPTTRAAAPRPREGQPPPR